MITWTKPSGLTVVTNDMQETIDYCESLKWTRKRKRRTAEEMAAAQADDAVADGAAVEAAAEAAAEAVD